MSRMRVFDPKEIFVELSGAGDGQKLPAGPDFWFRLMDRSLTISGWLVTMLAYRSDWPQWERHPAGEELLVLMDGKVDIVVDDGNAVDTMPMAAGQAYLVPRGVWHRAVVREPGTMLHVTWGEGTEHRPV